VSGAAAATPGRVRRAGPGDLDAITDLWLAIGAHHEPLDPAFAQRRDARPEARRLLAALLRDPDVAAWVLDAGRGPEGLCIARIDRAPPITRETERAEITDVGVRPERRGRGAGRALALAALAWVRERKVSRVEVRVAVGNAEGQALWRGLGFGDFMDVLQRRL
jgi:ribosomal protein S18 acetylase RimI-like enzyme